jgi:uncharacterized phage protein (TIGR01671 family)
MREILFRGKRKDNGKWAVGSFLKRTNPCIEQLEFAEDGVLEPYIYEVIPETVGQYTGLCDKNGKKIFEGDVVSYLGFCYRDSISKVAFGLGTYDSGIYEYNGWIIEITEDALDCMALTRYNIEDNNVEIIGNIHDNPELLKGGAE